MLNFKESLELSLSYLKRKTLEQLRSVAFIIIYLFLFQRFILNLPLSSPFEVILGIISVVMGLTFFMEGLVLGLMPIGENLGIKLPSKAPLVLIILFALILGIGATYAEPAIGILRAMGVSVSAKSAPLLYYVLNFKTEELVLSVGFGVGLAVIFGILRILNNWSLKPLIYILVSLTALLSSYALYEPDFVHFLGLAWDCGAVTTGPVTVPLVLALGLGISRVVTGHSSEGAMSGFGVVTLASLFPILAVLILGIYYQESIDIRSFLESTPLAASSKDESNFIWSGFKIAAQAVLPLCLFMTIVYKFFLREKFKFIDEIIFGVILSLAGFTLFNIGIELGLGNLGQQVGKVLPAAYSSIQLEEEAVTITPFDSSFLQKSIGLDGNENKFFYVEKKGVTEKIKYQSSFHNEEEKSYRLIPSYGPLWGEDQHNFFGIFVVLIFAFFMGYGATLAEPALNTLGATVEEISVGTFKKSTLMQAVAFGVGIGIALGFSKIIWDLPLFWMIIPPYFFLLLLSFFSTEEFVNIAWDSAGVTTGPVTVPLVLAMGLGIGSQSISIEGFGILAMASLCPIIAVLTVGLWIKRSRQKILIDEDRQNNLVEIA